MTIGTRHILRVTTKVFDNDINSPSIQANTSERVHNPPILDENEIPSCLEAQPALSIKQYNFVYTTHTSFSVYRTTNLFSIGKQSRQGSPWSSSDIQSNSSR